VQRADDRGDADEGDVDADDDGEHHRGVLNDGGEAVGPERGDHDWSWRKTNGPS
jgi:hypothetical protein